MTSGRLDKLLCNIGLEELGNRAHPARVLIDLRLNTFRRCAGRPEPVDLRCVYCDRSPKKPCKGSEAQAAWLQRHSSDAHFTCRCCEGKSVKFQTYVDYLVHIKEAHRGKSLQ